LIKDLSSIALFLYYYQIRSATKEFFFSKSLHQYKLIFILVGTFGFRVLVACNLKYYVAWQG